MRFCRSCRSCLLCSSGSRRWAASWACCLLWASVRSLFSCCKRWKSRLSVDSPGTLRMELIRGWKGDDGNNQRPSEREREGEKEIEPFKAVTLTLCHRRDSHPLHHCHCTHTQFPLWGRREGKSQNITVKISAHQSTPPLKLNPSCLGYILLDFFHIPSIPFSPRFLRVRSMWSLSWIRTCRSVGWSLINECFSSCSVDGRLGYVFTRQPSIKSMNFLDLGGSEGGGYRITNW